MAALTKDQVRQIIAQAPPGTSPEGVVAALRESHQLEGYDSTSAPAQVPQLRTTPPLGQRLYNKGLASLPTAGGFVGGLMGGGIGAAAGGWPAYFGGVAGATAGGAVGEMGKQVLLGHADPGEVAKQGAQQGAYEVAGQALGRGGRLVGKSMYKGALRASPALMEKHPKLLETAIEDRIPIGKMPWEKEAGSATANRLRRESSKALQNTLNYYKLKGVRFRTNNVTAQARQLLNDKSLDQAERDHIATLVSAFEKDKGATIDPVLLKGIKRRYQNKATAQYSKGAEGGIAATNPEYAASLAKGAELELEKLPAVPGSGGLGVEQQEARTFALKGVTKAVKRAETRPPVRVNYLQPETYPGLRSPELESRLGLIMSHPAFATLRQTPRGMALIAQLMQSDEPDQTDQGR